LIRRALINWRLPSYSAIWPIDSQSAKPPEGWKGWPGGKKFALVLTHDVDTQIGYKNSRQLAEMEERLGFRSSFYFVAEDLKMSADLFNYLIAKGSEIGIHGIHHSNPFRSKRHFQKIVPKINRFLKEWNAVGFRSPSMYHNLDWIHDLNIEYDASTFDTDPFEPQPDGMGTIFPFWVPSPHQLNRPKRPNRPDRPDEPNIPNRPAGPNDQIDQIDQNGYVEFPYTLPQDFLLFIIMREKNIDIWKKKLDWIVEKGGMVLFISHPDYMNFSKTSHSETYPSQYYEEFLSYIKTRYEGQYWHALPREVAHYFKQFYFTQSNKPKGLKKPKDQTDSITQATRKPLRVCMLTYSFYANDARVRRYAESLAQRGDYVDVLSLGTEGEKTYEIINGVHIYRIQKRVKDEKGQLDYILKILKFLFNSSFHLTSKYFKSRYDLIHVHSIPDFEVFAAILPKIFGKKIILDIHDPVPDIYTAKFGYDNKLFTFLSFLERISAKFSDHVITVTDYWMGKIATRSKLPDNKISVILNLPDIKMFNLSNIKEPRNTNEYFTIIYPGTINKHCGLDIAVMAIDLVKKVIPKIRLEIFGGGPELGNLLLLIKKLNLENFIFYRGFVLLDTVPKLMYSADLGIALLAGHDDYAQQALNVKLFEFLSMGLPAIATRTKSIEYYLSEDIVMLSEPNDPNDVAKCIQELYRNLERRTALKENGLAYIAQNNAEIQMYNYLNLVDKMI